MICYGDLDEILAQWNDLQSVKKELDYAAAHPEEYDLDDLASLQEDVAYCEETIGESFASFKRATRKNEAER